METKVMIKVKTKTRSRSCSRRRKSKSSSSDNPEVALIGKQLFSGPENISPIKQEEEQVEFLVDSLVLKGILNKSSYVIETSAVREMCQTHVGKLAAFQSKISCLGFILMTYGYLDFKTKPGTYTFKKSKIDQVIDKHVKSGALKLTELIPQTNGHDTRESKQQDLNYLVNLLIDSNILSEENNVVDRHKIRRILCSHKDKMPNIPPNELGYNLGSYGFIENGSAEGTYKFVKRRMRDIFSERNCRNVEAKLSRQVVIKSGPDDLSEWDVVRSVTFAHQKNDNWTLSSKGCCVCRKNFRLESHFEEHMANIHGPQFQIPNQFTLEKKSLPGVFEMKVIPSVEFASNITLSLQNVSGDVVAINKIYYIYSDQFVPLTYVTGENALMEFQLHRDFFISEEKQHSVILYFGDDQQEYIEHFFIRISKSLDYCDNVPVTNQTVAIKRRVINPIRPRPLREYKPMKEIIKLFNYGFKLDTSFTEQEMDICNKVRNFLRDDPNTRLNPNNYVEMLSFMIQIADCGQERSMIAFDQANKQLSVKTAGCYAINLNSLNGLPDELTEGDFIHLRKTNTSGQTLGKGNGRVLAQIMKFDGDQLIVEVVDDGRIDVEAQYNLRFKSNRVPIKTEHQALEIMDQERLSKFMFPEPLDEDDEEEEDLEINEFKWFNRSIRTNPEQIQAIKYIVNGTAQTAPYIVFGPPGTGKTSTIVETICQLYTVLDTSRILVTAQSNAACNEIVERLLKFLPSSDIYRLFAPSWEKKADQIPTELLQISNLASGRHQYPGWQDFYEQRVVVCTLTTAGRLVQANIQPNHFTHVFIDECASATEPAALIPIAGIISSMKQIKGQLILAGDIKQLGPIVKTRFAEKLGYGVPLMERLMNRPLYEKNPETRKYNPRVITKLIRNFRSHSKIIEFSNNMFYDGDLLAKAQPLSTDWALGWKLLPNKKFPIMLLPCYGETKKEKNCFSSYNLQEIEKIERVVRHLLTDGVRGRAIAQSDIGIISPYKRQCSKLSLRFGDHNWNDIEVGTVETYQGREKPVIIISTVRSNSDNIGFLNNPKRLNVSITRAQALLVLVGNPNTLRHDPHWYDLLDYIVKNGGCAEPISLDGRPCERLSTSTEDLLNELNALDIKQPAALKVTAADFI